ncbi:hypothetical protein A1OE_865 [Candidatus Endolissoclinum faulkneri L2]|uniref:Uncharacterized protein n=1 Tax=Candidatus Endolissoclinum faulkneri L2 TaxID=1193729 RepID=K7YR92_9PROT|nr:hypothetical protein A1OE_865 [Candidatus Endolissoclinum faulkneri L2]
MPRKFLIKYNFYYSSIRNSLSSYKVIKMQNIYLQYYDLFDFTRVRNNNKKFI